MSRARTHAKRRASFRSHVARAEVAAQELQRRRGWAALLASRVVFPLPVDAVVEYLPLQADAASSSNA